MLEDPAFPYQCHIGYGCLEIYPTELLNSTKAASEVPDYALNQDELILDHIYDIPALGRQAGHLILYLEAEQVSFESAANIMLDLKARFDEAGVPFAAMDLTVQPPRAEDGQRPDGEIRVEWASHATRSFRTDLWTASGRRIRNWRNITPRRMRNGSARRPHCPNRSRSTGEIKAGENRVATVFTQLFTG